VNDQEHRRKSLADDLEVDLDLNADQSDREHQNHAIEAYHVTDHATVAIDHVDAVVTALAIVDQPKVTTKVAMRNLTLWQFSICITKLTKMNLDEFLKDMERLRNVTL